MTLMTAQARTQFIQWLDRLFWVVWLLFPVLIWSSYSTLIDVNALQAQLPGVDPACLQKVPQVPLFSTAGKLTVFAYALAQNAIYAALLAFAHITIHRCARGNVFAHQTLRMLAMSGVLIFAWSFLDLLANNLVAYIIYRTGDIPAFIPNYALDVGPIGVGMLILAMCLVMEQAISIKQDQDLTI